MKILLLGATGRTGKFIIQEAIRRGHKISAIARNPEKLKEYQIDITKGTPYDFETVEKAIVGCEAVINTLNISRKSDNPWAGLVSPKDLISKSATNAVLAMKEVGIKRFIALRTIGREIFRLREWQGRLNYDFNKLRKQKTEEFLAN